MTYTANLDSIPPTVGTSKKLWSPNLFNAADGSYSLANAGGLPVGYHTPFQYFLSSSLAGGGTTVLWPLSDSGDVSGAAAYSTADKLISPPSLGSATGSVDLSAVNTGPTSQQIVWSWAGSPTTPLDFKLYITMLCSDTSESLYSDGYPVGFSSSGNVLEYSTNGGSTWTALTLPLVVSTGSSFHGIHPATETDWETDSMVSTLLVFDLGTINPANVKVRVTSSAVGSPSTVPGVATASIFALCLANGF